MPAESLPPPTLRTATDAIRAVLPVLSRTELEQVALNLLQAYDDLAHALGVTVYETVTLESRD